MKANQLLTVYTLSFLLLSCGNSKEESDATGSFEATEIIVSSEANGRILTFNLNEGDQLQEGQKVGIIDTTQLYLQKMSLLSNARGIKAQKPDIRKQTASIEEQINTLKREKARVERLLAANAANQKQIDDIEAQIDLLQKQLVAVKSTLEKSSEHISAQSSTLDIQVAQIDDQLAKTRIISPITGTVLNRYVEAGELAMMGTPLFKIANTDTLNLRAYVTNDQLAKITLNDDVTVRVDDGTGIMKSYTGRITWISSKSEFTPKTIQTKNERANLVYAIKVAVPNDGYLKIGMYGEIMFSAIN